MTAISMRAALNANAHILMGALTTHGPGLADETLAGIQAYLNNTIDRNGLNNLSFAMSALLSKEEKLQLLNYNAAWESPLTWTAEHNMPLTQWHGPLLVWTHSQSWGANLDPEAFATMWHKTLPDFDRAAALMASVLHLSQDTPFPLERYRMLFDTCAKVQSWDGLNDKDDHVRREYVVSMGMAALACGGHYKDKWLMLLDTTTSDNRGTTVPILLDILASDLPRSFKLHSALRSLNTHWLNSSVTGLLKDVLPPDESTRCALIPWLTATNKPVSAAQFMRGYVAKSNEYLMAQYCPQRYALLGALATRDNWADRDWLNTMGSLDTNTASNLPLPQDLDGARP